LMPRFARYDLGYYEELCEEAKQILARGGKPTALQLHACQRLEEIRRKISKARNVEYDEERKVVVIYEDDAAGVV
jgi:hypothetical protein